MTSRPRLASRAPKIVSLAASVLLASACGTSDDEVTAYRITTLTRAEHEANFPIDTSVHLAASCNDCHGGFESFAEFSCTILCHDQTGHPEDRNRPRHQGVDAYQWNTAACIACHPEGK